MRSLRSLVGGILVLLLLGYIAIVAYMSSQETSLLFPGASRTNTASFLPATHAGFEWDSLRVTAADGVPVFLLESRLKAEAPWALFIHGNGGLVGDEIERYQLLKQAGFNVLAFEYRGYGISSDVGSPSEEGVYQDALAAWTYLTQTLNVRPQKIAVYGWSLGGGIATYLASKVTVGGLITEATFTSIPETAKIHFPWLPVEWIMRNEFDNMSRAGRLNIPWLIFHGTRDHLVPISHAQALDSVAPRSVYIELEGGHGPVAQNKVLVLSHLIDFRRQHLR